MSEVREARILRIVPLLIIICVPGVSADARYGGGTGEPNDPYLIYTPEQMNAIGAEPNDWDKHFKLMADIDLSTYRGNQFNLIGTYIAEENPNDRPFTGVFDGNGHVISHFSYASADQNEVGLFRCVGDGDSEIRDLTLADPNVSVPGGHNVGSLTGYLKHGVVVRCRITGGAVSGEENVGGLVGKDGCEVTRVSANSRVYPLISECCFTGTVSAKRFVGGLVGYNLTGQILFSCATGHVTGQDRTGGLAGVSASGYIEACYSTVGVAGENVVGGLVGECVWMIRNCYAAGRVSGRAWVGGLVGYQEQGTFTACFWDLVTTGQLTSPGGAGKTTVEMQAAATFLDAGWDFVGEAVNGEEDIWRIREGQDYPRLSWEAERN